MAAIGSISSDAIEFTIAEQTGDRRTLTLSERALPYRPIEWSVEQAAEWTRYMGNPIKTLQILGPDDLPTDINGFWKERFINDPIRRPASYTQNGATVPLLATTDLVNLCNDMCRKGQVVVVQWGPEVRRGLLKRFSRKWHNVRDAEWSMRFEWQSQNDADAPAVMSKDTDFANALGTLNAYTQAIQTLLTDAEDLAGAQITLYQSYTTTLDNLVTQFQDTVSNVLDTIMPIIDQQRRIAGILNDVAATSDQMAGAISATPAASQAIGTSSSSAALTGTTVATDGAVLAVESTLRQLTSKLRDMKFSALETQADVLKSISPDIISAFTARGLTDLRDVSADFYQTQDEWRSLMLFNRLTDSRLAAGQTVFVPKLIRPLDGSQ